MIDINNSIYNNTSEVSKQDYRQLVQLLAADSQHHEQHNGSS